MRIIDADEFLINMVSFFKCIPTLTNGLTEMMLTDAILSQKVLELEDVIDLYNQKIGGTDKLT